MELSLYRFIINKRPHLLVCIFRCSSSPCNPVYSRRVDPSTLDFSLSSHKEILEEHLYNSTFTSFPRSLSSMFCHMSSSIKSFEERKDSKGKDNFVLSDWWKSNCATLPGFADVLRAVLTNSPNSCPPERLFSIFNATYDDDQKSSDDDYIELSM
jgi:hypothetical protein